MRILFALLVFFGLGAAQAAEFEFDLTGQALLQSSPVGPFDVMFTVDSQSGELLVIDLPGSLELSNDFLTVVNYSAVVNGQLIHQLPVTSGLVNFATIGLGSGMEIGLGPTNEFIWSTQNFFRNQLEAALATSDPLGYLFPLMSGDRATLETGNSLGQVYDLDVTSVSIRSVPEPGIVVLMVFGLLGLWAVSGRREPLGTPRD